ncbi:hypothetical protein HDU86_004234 [Geranomyces michiganensis]|nr:hypothetical protein HDU86_004234 [Geranomyces michiganensis]
MAATVVESQFRPQLHHFQVSQQPPQQQLQPPPQQQQQQSHHHHQQQPPQQQQHEFRHPEQQQQLQQVSSSAGGALSSRQQHHVLCKALQSIQLDDWKVAAKSLSPSPTRPPPNISEPQVRVPDAVRIADAQQLLPNAPAGLRQSPPPPPPQQQQQQQPQMQPPLQMQPLMERQQRLSMAAHQNGESALPNAQHPHPNFHQQNARVTAPVQRLPQYQYPYVQHQQHQQQQQRNQYPPQQQQHQHHQHQHHHQHHHLQRQQQHHQHRRPVSPAPFPANAATAAVSASARKPIVTIGFSPTFEHPTTATHHSRSLPNDPFLRMPGYIMGGGDANSSSSSSPHDDGGLVITARPANNAMPVKGTASISTGSSGGSAGRCASAPTRLLPKRTFPMASWATPEKPPPAKHIVKTIWRAETEDAKGRSERVKEIATAGRGQRE